MVSSYFRENVGLLGLTRVGSRRVVQISAGFMIFFSTLGNEITFSDTSIHITCVFIKKIKMVTVIDDPSNKHGDIS